ncbi:unnamed protein product, partial [Larinioides sclopetarius]
MHGIRRWYIPKRYIFTGLGFFALMILYSMRASLSVAMVALVNSPEKTSLNATEKFVTCSNLLNYEVNERNFDFQGVKYDWDSTTQGLIFTSFNYGYVPTLLLGGVLSEKFGTKWLLGTSVLMSSFLYLLIPVAASWGSNAFITIRVIAGLTEGVSAPLLTLALSNWSPTSERSRIVSIIFAGVPVGMVIGAPLSGFLCSIDFLGGWPSVFYLFGIIGFVWFLFWIILMSEKPEGHPSISEEELLHIQRGKCDKPQTNHEVPWKDIFLSLPMWATCIAMTGNIFGFIFLSTDLPKYYKAILHVNIRKGGFISALPYVVEFFSLILCAYIADKLREWNKMSITTIRKIFNSVGLFGFALCLIAITQSGCRPELIIGFLCLAMFSNGFLYSGHRAAIIDINPKHSGVVCSIANAFSLISGSFSPTIAGLLTESGDTLENWNKIFYITSAVSIGCGIFFVIFGSAELQSFLACSRRCYVPKRFIVAFLGFFGLVNVYALRVNLSVAMVAMVNNTEEKANVFNSSGDECPYIIERDDDSTMDQSNLLGEKYDWDAKTQGMIMSSFFYAYFITVLTGGYFAKRFGAKLMFGAGVGSTSVLTLLTPVAVRWGVIPFIVVRALEGVGEGLTYPAINTMVSQWAPKLERSRISSAVFSGAPIGTVLSLSASGLMCKSEALGGWPSVFYVFGAIGCFWYGLWIIFIYETPDEHPTISKEELFLIYESEENQLSQKDLNIPWKKIFTSLPMWGVLFGHVGSYFGLAVLMTELPSYLSGVLHYSVEMSGLLTGLPNLLEALGGMMASYVADKLISSKKMSVTAVRKMFQSI